MQQVSLIQELLRDIDTSFWSLYDWIGTKVWKRERGKRIRQRDGEREWKKERKKELMNEWKETLNIEDLTFEWMNECNKKLP